MPLPIPRPVVFPLFGVTNGQCACGNPGCTRVGKHAAVTWRDVEWGSPVPRPEPGAGYAIRTGAHPKGSDCFFVDLDGEAAALLFDGMGPCPDTFTVRTPRAGGGWHLGFKHPGFHVRTSSGTLGKGIDIRGDGGIIVGPGSPHANGGTYEIDDDLPLADAPEWLLAWLRTQQAPTESQHYPGDIEDPIELERRRVLYAEYLKHEAPARGPELRGQGDVTLFDVVQRGAYDLALPVDDVLELVERYYDPRCSPMWGPELEERVHHKAHDAKTTSTRPRAEPLPEDLAHLAGGTTPTGDTLAAQIADILAEPGPGLTPSPRAVRDPDDLGVTWGGWDEIISPPVYLLDGLIPEGKVVTFFAEGGSLKSWAAFQLAISVSTGEPWLGRAVKQGPALILDYEDGRYEFQRRMRILRGGNLEALPDLGYVYHPGKLTDPTLWLKLTRAAKAMGIRLVVIDTLGGGMPAAVDENKREFSEAVALAGLFTELGVTVVIVAHANKTGGLRGHGSIRDSSDVVFFFEPVAETDMTKRMRMVCDKPGPQKKPKPVNVELTDGGLSSFEDEAADVARNATTPEDLGAAILLALANGPIPTKEKIRAAVRKDANLVSVELGALVTLGMVAKIPGVGYILDDPAKREERVLACVQASDGYKSQSALALAASVPVRVVAAMVTARQIIPRQVGAGGGFIIP